MSLSLIEEELTKAARIEIAAEIHTAVSAVRRLFEALPPHQRSLIINDIFDRTSNEVRSDLILHRIEAHCQVRLVGIRVRQKVEQLIKAVENDPSLIEPK